MTVKNASGSALRLLASGDGVRYSAYPAGDKPTAFTELFARADGTPVGNGWVPMDTTNQSAAQILSGAAFGTQAAAAGGAGPWNDAIITRPGFGSNYRIAGTVKIRAGASGSGNREVEIWGRASIGSSRTVAGFGTTTVYGYEGNTHILGDYLNISRFFAPSPLSGGTATGIGAWTTGDLYEMIFTTASPGVRIQALVRGSQVIDVTDSAAGFYASGDPGIGWFADNANRVDDFGFDAVTITAL